jgi:MFS transporter, DHA3 family, macrolide efflux protein
MALENKIQPSSQWKKPFFIFWIGQNISILGSSLVQFALIWWITKQTGSATVLAISTGITFIPRVLLGPFIGALIDR